jgi:hypothetical protein
VEARNNLVHKGLLWVDAVDKVGGATGLVVPGAAPKGIGSISGAGSVKAGQ